MLALAGRRYTPEWPVAGRALVVSLVVGTVLVGTNHGGELLRGAAPAGLIWQLPLTYAVPFAVSLLSSVLAARSERRRTRETINALERRVEIFSRFPDANPNPVLRITPTGQLLYANMSSAPLIGCWGTAVGGQIPPALLERFRAASSVSPPETIEAEVDHRTYALLAVPLPALDAISVYGTDVTAAKLLDRFPGLNPNPVFRLAPDGTLVYANAASQPIVRAFGVDVGGVVADGQARPLLAVLGAVLGADSPAEGPPLEIQSEGRTYALKPVAFREMGLVNVYGTDVTAAKAVNKFPDQNPNPVLRTTKDGRLAYANPASALILKRLGVGVGGALPAAFLDQIQRALVPGEPNVIELESEGRTYELLVVSVYEYDFVNLYGTDVTAARQVEWAKQEIERLLLNILPESIAARLRGGETVIADRFEEMTILFADVVDFTRLSARLTPEQLVQTLNRVFTVFDHLAERYGLEKIKTIGDAYMVVGGLTPHSGDHVRRVASMGQDMIAACAALTGLPGVDDGAVQIRVGMHTGPGIGGVIGIKKFIYDVWGDAVNTASRMESHGVPGRIQVTEAAYERLKDVYRFEPRGMIDVKGKGLMRTFLLSGPASAGVAAPGSAGYISMVS
ncbi:MAG TPA: adenylate/guanylate cyclase domain-containing protein [Chloroflexota bacterium]|nr:adenylate/guanylate cyclase domain-containing protein [Chloroflexota bacterium]